MSSFTIVDTFKAKLEDEWTRTPNCQVRPGCQCLPPFISTASLKQWMDRKERGKSETNGKRVLDEVNAIRWTNFLNSGLVFEGDHSCVLVFSCLLKQDQGRLIYIFRNANILDKNLSDPKLGYNPLRVKLTRHKALHRIDNVEKIINDFEKNRWAFCPAHLDQELLDNIRFGAKLLLPFCTRDLVNDKGGTASVSQVTVPEEYVSLEIKKHLGEPFDFGEYGKCYELVVKSFSEGQRGTYDNEVEAFTGLRDKPGMVRSFGCYRQADDKNRGHGTCNILLEYGNVDLGEFFVSYDAPQRLAEIYLNWKSLCEVAKAIETIHELSYQEENYYGWHGDVKPDNILRVRDKWKLADFGFAEFRRVKDANSQPTADMRGGTETYGPPESTQARSQTIDTWSFGCVLSVMATWVVIGASGVETFQLLRKQACVRQKRERQQAFETRKLTIMMDAFHDGVEVLPEIKHWHDHLKEVMRKSDFITPKILDLVDRKMLKKDPRDRLSSKNLCKELDSIVTAAEAHLREIPKKTHAFVQAALLSAEKGHKSVKSGEGKTNSHVYFQIESSTDKGPPLQVPLTPRGLPSRRRSKAKQMESPRHSIPHREETLKQDLDKSGIKVSMVYEEGDSEGADPIRETSRSSLTSPSFQRPHRDDSPQQPVSSPHLPAPTTHQSQSLPQTPPPTSTSEIPPSATAHGTNQAMPPTSLGFPSARSDPISDEKAIWDAVNDRGTAAMTLCQQIMSRNPMAAKLTCHNGLTPIMIAARDIKLQVVNYLVEYSNVLHQDGDGNTVLHHLILGLASHANRDTGREFQETIENLSHSNAHLVNTLDDHHRSPLYYCVNPDMLKTAEILVDAGAWITHAGDTPESDIFGEAVENGTPEMVKYFLENKKTKVLVNWAHLPDRKKISPRIWHLLEEHNQTKGTSTTNGGLFNRWTGSKRKKIGK